MLAVLRNQPHRQIMSPGQLMTPVITVRGPDASAVPPRSDKGGFTTTAIHQLDYNSSSHSPPLSSSRLAPARMPGRDPAVHTHLPSPSTSPTDERPVGRNRSSSSAITRIPSDTHHSYGSAAGTQSGRRVSTTDGPITRLLRRVSVSTDRPERHDVESLAEPSGAASDIEEDHDETVPLGASTSSAAIRDSTNRLASMSFSLMSQAPTSGSAIHFDPHTLYPQAGRRASQSPNASVDLGTTPRVTPMSPHSGPSGLSMLMERGRKAAVGGSDSDSGETTPHASARSLESESPVQGVNANLAPSTISRQDARRSSHGSSHIHERTTYLAEVEEVDEEDMGGSSELRQFLAEGATLPTERTPLLSTAKRRWNARPAVDFKNARSRLEKITTADVVDACVLEPLRAMPAVILGLLLNVLDGVSYGMILFPASEYYPDYGSLGVSMFFMSCIISQLTFSLGGSIFKAGNGSMMIEAVPFFHIICQLIITEIGDDADAIVATTMVSFAFSSVLTGLVFFALGAFKLGALIGYFPRHILIGCIGGVGVFLIVTGLQVSLGLGEEGFEYNLPTLKLFFASWHNVILWTLPLGLAILLRVITHFFHHQLIFPVYFFVIPTVFYIVVAIGGWSFPYLRDSGWVFDVGSNIQPWYTFYSGFKFSHVNWSVFWSAMPTQMALVFFGILHVPLNVPALGVTLSEDNVKLDRELVAHGISNLGAGFLGTVPNYLTYVNSVLFYRVGGDTRLAGLMLAAATAAIMCVGPTVIGYLPVMVVGALIYVLGIDLVIEAVWDTRHRVNRMEYITIWVIMIGMTIFDFVIGLLLGIILACVFFVVQSSRRRPIRAVFNGSTAKSTVRRPRTQRAFIQRVGSQTCVMKLQGFLFFGTIGVVEDEIRRLIDIAEWEHNPIRFLIIDFALVAGLDFSSAEAFVRIQRLIAAKDVLLILCGADPYGLVGTALRAVDLWAEASGTRVEVFDTLNNALEWTENAYLTAFYDNQIRRKSDGPVRSIDLPKISRMPFTLAESFQNSPRRTLLAKAGDDTLPTHYPLPQPDTSSFSTAPPHGRQPLTIMVQTMGSYADEPETFFAQFTDYFKQVIAHAGDILWRQGDDSDGLYLIEAGSLRATYEYHSEEHLVQETMVAGTVAGDLSTLSGTVRNATVVAERDSVLWKLSSEALAQMAKEKPEAAGQFTKILLKGASEEVDVLASHLIAVLS